MSSVCDSTRVVVYMSGATLAHLFGPVHPVEPRHLAVVHHLLLGGIPEVVVRLPLLQLVPAMAIPV